MIRSLKFALPALASSLLAFSPAAPALGQDQDEGKTPQVGDMAPNWTLEDPEGEPHSLSDYRGKVVVMDFWATWCGPCKRAMPGVQRLHEQFEDQPVEVFGITVWENGDPEAYMEEQDYTYGLLLNGDPVGEAYNVRGIPTFYVVGFDGEIIYYKRGFQPNFEKKVAEVIEEYLEEHSET